MSPKSGCPQGLGVPRCVCPSPCASPGPCVRAGDGATVPSQGDIPPAAPELGGDVWRPPRPPSLARHCHRHLAGAPVATHVPCTPVHHHACASACTRACVLVRPPCTGGGGSVGTWGPGGFVPRFCPHVLGTWWPGRWQGPPCSPSSGDIGDGPSPSRRCPLLGTILSPPSQAPAGPPSPPPGDCPQCHPRVLRLGTGDTASPPLGGFGVTAWWHRGTAAPGGGLWGQLGAPPRSHMSLGGDGDRKGTRGQEGDMGMGLSCATLHRAGSACTSACDLVQPRTRGGDLARGRGT